MFVNKQSQQMKIKSILKKGDDSTKKIFKQYLEEKNLWVFPEKLTSEFYKIRNQINLNELKNDYFISRVVNSSIDKIINHKEYFQFFSYCLNNNHKDILISQLIIKTPKTNSDHFNEYILDVLNLISKDEDILLKFINRSAFLNSSWIFLGDFLEHIKNPNYIKDVLKTLAKTTAFSSSDNQKEIFSLFSKTQIEQDYLIPFFNKISINDKVQSPIVSLDIEKSIILSLSKKYLISVNLHNNLGSSLLISTIVEHLNFIKLNFVHLKISKVFVDYVKENKNYNIYLFCSEEQIGLNSYLLEKIIFLIANQESLDDLKSLVNNYSLFIREQSSQYMYLKLNRELESPIKIETSSHKI